MDTWIIILTTFIGSIFLYWWHKATYFKRRNIPYCTPFPLVGNLLPLILKRKKKLDIYREYYDRWPNAKYFGFFYYSKPIIVIRDPEITTSIAVKNFDNFLNHQNIFDDKLDPLMSRNLMALKDDKWRSVRSVISPAFTSNKIKTMYNLVANCAKNIAEIVVIAIKDEGTSLEIDMKEATSKYTNDVIATCAFGVQIDSVQYPDNEFFIFGTTLSNLFSWRSIRSSLLYFFPWLSKYLGIRLVDSKTTHYFRNVIKEAIRIRQEKNETRPDMIQQMLDDNKDPKGAQTFSIDDILAQSFLFFYSGREVSKQLASFASMELAINSEVQCRLQEEIDVTLKKCDGKPTYETINEMPFLDAVLFETLRFYPNVLTLSRICNHTFDLPPTLPGHDPVTVQPGTTVWIAVDGIHHDPKYYEDPNKFDPDRFLNKKLYINEGKFLAFGIGPRSCIGSRFAMMEVKLFLFHLLARCTLKPTPKTPVPLVFSKDTFELTFENGYKLIIDSRKNSYFGPGV